MSQIDLLKRIIARPMVFRHEWQRGIARQNLFQKLKRRDIQRRRKTQTTLFSETVDSKQ